MTAAAPTPAETLVLASIDKVRAIVSDQLVANVDHRVVKDALGVVLDSLNEAAAPDKVSAIASLGTDGLKQFLSAAVSSGDREANLARLAAEAGVEEILREMDETTAGLEAATAAREARRLAMVDLAERIGTVGLKMLLVLIAAA